MRRIPLALALVGAVAVTGCMGGGKSSNTTDSDVQKGVTGSYYYINIKPPVGGSITSDIGGINCGASAVTVNNAVNPPQYAYTYISSACGTNGQTQIPWASSVVLTAVPAAGKAFIGWAGDCSGTALTCTVSTASNGADKTVIAIFGEPGSGHGMPFPGSVHGPASVGGVYDCFSCHGNMGQGQGIAPACTTCHDGAPPPNPTGLKVAVNSVSGTTVYFTVQDNAGNPVDVTGADGKNRAMQLRFALASFGTDAGGRVLPYAVRTGTATSPSTSNTATPPVISPAPGPGLVTSSAPGVYTYTFPSTVTYDGAAVAANTPHTVWIQTARQEDLVTNGSRTYTPVNVQFNYSPQNGTPVAAREVASQAGCDNCHNGFKSPGALVSGFHGGGRIEVGYCDVCHNPARESGSGKAADAAVFVHRIHGANQIGLPSSLWFDGITATYPQAVTNCSSCHAGAAQGSQWQTRPTRQACGSCHYTVDFATGANHNSPPNNNPAFPSDIVVTTDACTGCHSATSIAGYHVPVELSGTVTLSAGPALPTGAVPITYDVSNVSTWIDPSATPPNNRRPQITFALIKNGAAVNFGTYISTAGNPVTDNRLIIPGYTGSPNAYFAWAVPQDGIAAPADFNATASFSVQNCWQAPTGADCNLIGPDPSGYYTLQYKKAIIQADAALLTGGLGYTSAMTQTDLAAYPGGLRVSTPNVWKAATGFTGRRVAVSTAGCTACHAQLGVAPTFHSGGRNDAPSCSFCHTGNRASNGWSGNASTFIHALHGASKRTVDYTWAASACATGFTWDAVNKVCTDGTTTALPAFWPPEIEYPNQLKNCEACHVAGGFDFSAAPVANLLWTTVATGTLTSTGTSAIRNSPYVTAGTPYGSGFSYAAATGVTTAAAATTLVSSPISAACFSCHDSPTARTHIESMGGWIYKARGSSFDATLNAETCLGCHGAGKTFPIAAVH